MTDILPYFLDTFHHNSQWVALCEHVHRDSLRAPLPVVAQAESMLAQVALSSPKERGAVLRLIYGIALVNADDPRALDALDAAEQRLSLTADKALRGWLYLSRARITMVFDRVAEVRAALDAAASCLDHTPDNQLYRAWLLADLRWWVLYTEPKKAGRAFSRWDEVPATYISAAEQAMWQGLQAIWHYRQGQLQPALTLLAAALPGLAAEEGWIGDELRSRAIQAELLRETGAIETAWELLAEALALARLAGMRLQAARVLMLMGMLRLRETLDFEAGLDYLTQADEVYMALTPDSRTAWVTRYQVGVAHFYRGELTAASRVFTDVEAFSRAHHHDGLLAIVLGAQGDLLYRVSRFAEALVKFEQAQHLCETHHYLTDRHNILFGQMRLYLTLGQPDQVIALFKKVHHYIRKERLNIPTHQMLYIQALLALGHERRALGMAWVLLRGLPDNTGRQLRLEIELLLGRLLMLAGYLAEARVCVLGVRYQARQLAAGLVLWHAELLLAEISYRENNLAATQAICGGLLPLLKGYPSLTWQVYYLLGLCAWRQGALPLALERCRQALAHVQRSRITLPVEEWSTGYMHDARKVFEFAARVAHELNMLPDTLQVAEAYRAQVLAYQLQYGHLLASGGSQFQRLNERLDQIRMQIKAIRQSPWQVPPLLTRVTRMAMQPVSSAVADLYDEYSRVNNALRSVLHVTHQIEDSELGFDLTAFRQTLHRTNGTHWQALAYFALDDGRLLIFVIGPDEFQVVQTAWSAVATYLDLVLSDKNGRVPLAAEEHKAARQRLYQVLIPASCRARLHPQHTLYIIPTNGLHRLPFQGLQSPEDDYLIQQTAVSVVPSLRTLMLLADRPVKPTTERVLCLARSEFDYRLADLPYVKREVEAMQQILKGRLDVLWNDQATLAALQQLEQADDSLPDTLHLISHAHFVNRQVRASAISLDGADLLLNDITNLKLPGLLVVLSTCDGGLHAAGPGEEWVGLTTAFFTAGARNILSGLWRLRDRQMAGLIRKFYQRRLAGDSPAMALAAAQRQYIDQQFSPEVWAGLTSFGP